jgi:8-amino-7-oxononanoate synthase
MCEGAHRFGTGAGASHLVSGHHRAHEELEHRLADFVRLPRALLFSSGYLANLAVVTTLARHSAEVFADRLNHASRISLSPAHTEEDLDHLVRMLHRVAASMS